LRIGKTTKNSGKQDRNAPASISTSLASRKKIILMNSKLVNTLRLGYKYIPSKAQLKQVFGRPKLHTKDSIPALPTVSVIIPAYNGAKYLEDTLQSVLNQKYQPLEIIVVDDGSTDQTVSLVKNLSIQQPKIKLFQQANSGVCAARNAGIRHSQGNCIALLDQDDRWLPDYLAHMVNYFKPMKIVTANYQKINESGEVIGVYNQIRSEETSLPGILTSSHVFLSGSIFERSLWDKVGPFDESLVGAGAEDWDWFIRAILLGATIQTIPGLVWQYRIHSANTTRNFKMMADNTERVLDKIFKENGYGLPPKLQAQQPHAYFINYIIAAGKFYSVNKLEEAQQYLNLARQASESEFFSLQTFISFLKIYAQSGNYQLSTTGSAAIEFIAAQARTEKERKQLESMGYVTLALLTMRSNLSYGSRQLIKAGQVCPTLPLQKGVYQTLFHYTRIYSTEIFNKNKQVFSRG
jgi:glycosyltransferase involved in cell wall biosynthesis